MSEAASVQKATATSFTADPMNKAQKKYERAKKTSKPGEGARFKALTASIASKGNVSDPAAVAAAIGRKKYGAKKMASMAAKGKKK